MQQYQRTLKISNSFILELLIFNLLQLIFLLSTSLLHYPNSSLSKLPNYQDNSSWQMQLLFQVFQFLYN